MTPHAVAKKAGVSTSTISYLINGKTKPQVYTILTLCNVLDVTMSELFDGLTVAKAGVKRTKDGMVQTGNSDSGSQQITSEENALIECYRHLSSQKKNC